MREKTPKPEEKEVTMTIQPLRPSRRLSTQKSIGSTVSVGIVGKGSLKDNKGPASIQDLLDQMDVGSKKTDSAKAGEIAAQRWRCQNRTARQIYDEFCEETSFTALTRIHKAQHFYKKIAWLLVCIFTVSYLSVQCYWLFVKYFQYPIEVKVELKSVPKMEFPSVTICNLNPLRRDMMWEGPFQNIAGSMFTHKDDDTLYDGYKDKLQQEMEEVNDTRMFDDNFDFDNEMETQMKAEEFNRWKMLENNTEMAQKFYGEMDESFMAKFAYSDTAANMSDSEVIKYGHQIENLIMTCTWKGMRCSPQNFTYTRNTKYGNCFTFNSKDNGREILTSDYAGPLMGLSLELNIEQDQYVSSLSNEAGVRVMVHKRGTYPFPEDEGFSIPPGYKSSIGITQTEIIRLPPPHADCGDRGDGVDNLYTENFGTEYTKQTCLKSCYQEIFQEKCGCVFSYYYVPKGVNICGFQTANMTCMSDGCTSVLETCSSRCPSPCRDRQFEFTMSMSKWPSEQFKEQLIRRLGKMNSQFLDEDRKEKSEDTLAKLEIYFKDLVYEQVEQQKAYETENLISDIGGQLGLWLGLSAITIGELIEFFVSLFRLITARMIRPKKECDKHPITTVSPMNA